jgi:hypothetical protein
MHLFSWEMNHHPIICHTYKASAAEQVSSHHFSLLPSHLSCYFQSFSATCYITSIMRSMAEGPSRDPTITNPPADEHTGSDSGVENIAVKASSPTCGATLMAKGEIHVPSDFFKKTSVTDNESQAYRECGWLTGNIISSIPEVGVPTVEGSTVVCFESHLVVRLGLLPSKFLVTIMGYLNYELFHFNPNAISTLSTFVMLCECWLGIASNTSLF